MTKQDAEYVTIGKIGSTYGVHGWLKIHTYTEHAENILTYAPWYLSRDGKNWQEVQIEDGRQHHNGIIAKFSHYDAPEQARELTGLLISIKHTQLPKLESDEYYWSDLEGLTVIDQHGNNIGKVIYLMETGSNDVLIVKGEIEQALPFLKDRVITRVDLAAGIIYVNWDPL